MHLQIPGEHQRAEHQNARSSHVGVALQKFPKISKNDEKIALPAIMHPRNLSHTVLSPARPYDEDHWVSIPYFLKIEASVPTDMT